jgi:hypothetical protein
MAAAVKKNKRGRPALPRGERAARRITVRVRAADEKIIAQLCKRLDVGESELVRRALQALAARVLVKP